MIQHAVATKDPSRARPRIWRRSLLVLGCVIVVMTGVWYFRVLVARLNAKLAMGNVRSIGSALEAYRAAKGSYPPVPSRRPVGELRPFLVPVFLRSIPDPAAPGHALFVLATDNHYEVWSLGEDGKDGPNFVNGPSNTLDADILLSDGEFLRYPDVNAWR